MKARPRTRPGAPLLLAIPLFLGSALAMPGAQAAPHPFGVEDLLRLARVSDPQLGPSKRMLYFAVSRARPDKNQWQSAIYAEELDANGQPAAPPEQLTFPERGPKQDGQDYHPRLFFDG